MRRRTLFAGLLLLVGLVLCSYPIFAQPKGKVHQNAKLAKRVPENLRGKWLLESRTVNGQRLTEPAGCYLLFTDDGLMQSYSPGPSSDGPGPTLVGNVYYRIDATKTPATIDTTGRTDWTGVSQGIVRLEKDSLTLCLAANGNSRPTTFSSGAAAGMGEVLLVYKRARIE